MGLFGLNIFDNLTEGQWTETSSCGFSKECKATKACIAQACTPARALYGESVYNPCVTKCQQEPRPKSLNELFCSDAKNAYDVWGFQCPGYTPVPEEKSGIKIGNSTISWYVIGAIFVAIIVLIILFL